MIQLPVLRLCCFPGNSNHRIQT